jgi:hypothetical protein
MPLNPGNFGSSLYGIDPYGSAFAPFGVAGATSYGPHFVQVRFTDVIDLTDPAFTAPSNYVLSPPLAVHAVVIESADSVVLQTDAQSFVTYTVTVGSARSYFQVPMYPPLNTAMFTGFPSNPGYFSCATSPTRVRLIFSTAMMSAPLLVLTNYTVSDFNGHVFTILSAQIEQTVGPALSVVLTLSTPLDTTGWYQTILSSNIVSTDSQTPQPPDHDFQFILPPLNVSVPISEFTGEVSGPLFGDPDGLVYFSPSLNVAASNSIIQVEEVDVCSIAYDTYTFPQPVDPFPFYTWSPTGPQTFLEQPGIVLFAGFPKMSEVEFEFGFSGEYLFDDVPPPYDTSVSIVMQQTFAPGYVALLNNPAWWMFDGVHKTTPPMWICANNLGPIPPGPADEITFLFVGVYGKATMTVDAPVVTHHAVVHMEANSTFLTSPEAPPTVISANSYMRVGRPNVNFGVTAGIVAGSSMRVNVPQGPQLQLANAAIVADSSLMAKVPQVLSASAAIEATSFLGAEYAEIHAGSSIVAVATVNRGVVAAIVAGSSAGGPMSAHRAVASAMSGQATIGAAPNVHHIASTAIQGASSVAATAKAHLAVSAVLSGDSSMQAHGSVP